MTRKGVLQQGRLGELTLPFDGPACPDVITPATPPAHARKPRCPGTPHKLTTYLPERAYLWARDQANAATCAGLSTSIADVLRLAVEQLQSRGIEQVRADLLRR